MGTGVLVRTEVAYVPKVFSHPCLQLVNLTDDCRLNLVRRKVLLVLS